MAFFTFIIGSVVALLIFLRFFAKPRCNLPSPKGLPIIGNILQFRQKRSELLLTKWSEELGPVFNVRMFNKDVVVVNDYASIRDVMLNNDKIFSGRAHALANRFRFINDYVDGIFVTNPGPEWKFLRQLVHSKIKAYDKGLTRVENVNMGVIDDMVNELNKRANFPLNPRDIVYNTTMNVMCAFLLGRTFGLEDPFFLLAKDVDLTQASIFGPGSKGGELDFMWWLRHFGNECYKKLCKLVVKKRDLWRQARTMVEADRSSGEDDSGGIIHYMLDVISENKVKVPSGITIDSIQTVFHDIVFAGTTTTANTFYAFLNIMLWYPEVQEKLRQEVEEVVGTERAVGLHDRQSMPYTRASIFELTRYTSIAPMGVAHCTLEDTTINGCAISKGTPVVTNLWALHHDQEFWTDPSEFKPERFLDDQDKLVSADHPVRKHLLPFGAGSRVCLGESLALGRLFLMIATVVQKFKMTPGPKLTSCDPRSYDTGIVISNADFEICFNPR